jgi:hypothetical protein
VLKKKFKTYTNNVNAIKLFSPLVTPKENKLERNNNYLPSGKAPLWEHRLLGWKVFPGTKEV